MTSLKPRRFGIELELSRRFLCVNNLDRSYSQHWTWLENMLYNLHERGLIERGWALKIDTSCGGEVVSPILHGGNGLTQVARICSEIQEYAYGVNISPVDAECGLHIHFDAADMKPRQLSNLFILLHTAEPIIYSMYPNRSLKYCAPIELNMRLASQFRDWTDVRDIWYRGENNVKDRKQRYSRNFINSNTAGDNYDGTRYHGFNIHCFWKQGTVEFRYGIGTLDPLHIKAYYEMCLSMFNTAMSKKKIKLSKIAKDLDYTSMLSYISANYRFRKVIEKLCRECQFSRTTIKLIMDLVRKNKSYLLRKPPRDVDDVVIIDISNAEKHIFRLPDGKFYYHTGQPIPAKELAMLNIKNSLVDCDYDWSTLRKNGNVRLMSINPRFNLTYRVSVNAADVERNNQIFMNEDMAIGTPDITNMHWPDGLGEDANNIWPDLAEAVGNGEATQNMIDVLNEHVNILVQQDEQVQEHTEQF